MDYWFECIAEAFEDAGIVATKEQINTVASWVKGAHDNYSQAHGYDCIPNPLLLENEMLKKSLDREKSKVVCDECKGKGFIVIDGPYHSSTSYCHVCKG